MENNQPKPKVSILMPAYNAQDYIIESIESIKHQTFDNWELIIIDDASSDQTFSLAEAESKKDSRIKVFHNSSRQDIAGVRNILLSKARGEYIAWQDADDISLPDRLQKQLELMENHSQVGICGGWLEIFSNHGIEGIRRYSVDDKKLRKDIFKFSPVAQPASMIRTKAILGLSYNKQYSGCEDIDMSFKIGVNWQFANVAQVVLRYRRHYNSATYQRLKFIERQTIKIRKKYRANSSYHFSVLDGAYNFFQLLTLNVMPVKARIYLFNFFRNKINA